MSQRLLKITYHDAQAVAAKKLNAYFRMPSDTLEVLRHEIEKYLCQVDQILPNCEFRTYWIDNDSDEIEVINQNDYEIFLHKCADNLHLQIAAARIEEKEAKQTPTSVPAEDDPSNFIIHDGVECDSCNTVPLVGFRYKCIQCPNFDLCQACESAHKHSQHLMVRMPTNNGPSVVDAWLSGPGTSSNSHRRSSRRFRGQCPFSEASNAATAPAATSGQAAPAGGAADSHKDSRRDRRHSRRHGGVFSQFIEMMMHLPESNVTPTPAPASGPSSTCRESKEKEPAATPTGQETVATAVKAESLQNAEKLKESKEIRRPKTSITSEPIGTANVEEPVAAPRGPKEQAKPQATTATNSTPTTPTTPVISLENLAQIVNPEYMRAGIEILNNFSEMFAKMIDPSEAAAFGCADTSMTSSGSVASGKSEPCPETPQSVNKKPTTQTTARPEPTESRESQKSPSQAVAQTAFDNVAVPDPAPNAEVDQRRRSDSLDQDWQMIDNSAVPIANVSSSDALINLNTTSTTTTTVTDASVSPVRDFVQLGEMLRQHVNDEQQREQATVNTQTSQVDTVSTSTSTTSVATNSTSTSTARDPPASEEKRHVLVYHRDERINAAVHAMIAMGFSNEGAWLTQLLESVDGNIPAALDIMHTSQSGRD